MLRPLRKINEVARQVAVGTLDQRIAMTGANDEFHQLADTFDSMLERLEHSFDEQRRFVANASHELRTPYAISRSILDVAIADPAHTDIATLLSRLDATNRRGSDTVEALLLLASLEQGATIHRLPVDIAQVVTDVVDDSRSLAAESGVEMRARLGEGDVDGHETLVRQLVTNLIHNGIRHNIGVGGFIEVTTTTQTGDAVELHVVNSGPVVTPEAVATLTEPFVRGSGRTATRIGRVGSNEGRGLGLAIVARVAEVHDAALDVQGRPEGGLTVRVRFPAPAAALRTATDNMR